MLHFACCLLSLLASLISQGIKERFETPAALIHAWFWKALLLHQSMGVCFVIEVTFILISGRCHGLSVRSM